MCDSSSNTKKHFKWKESDKKALIALTKKYFPWSSPHGKTGEMWEQICKEFNNSTNANVKVQTVKLKVEQLLESFQMLKEGDKNASGVMIVETFLQKDLSDIVCRINSLKDEKQKKIEKAEKKYAETVLFGEKIRENSKKKP
jgi:hypothetical protein